MRRLAVRLSFVVIAGLIGLAAIGYWGLERFRAPGPLMSPTTVIVPQGSSRADIARLLTSHGIISSTPIFEAGVSIFGRGRPLKAGEYAIPANLSARGVMELLQSGKTVVRKLTIAEGLTAAQVMAEIAGADGLSGATPPSPGEGKVLPETYHFSYGETRAEMLARMTKGMDETLAFLWAHRQANLPIKTPEQALILASIVEKETARPEERPHVAAVFLNRLKKDMRLQSDPTVIYALTDGERALGRALTHGDLEVTSPYNTYAVGGLPPGPIDNPGRESLAAVVRPADSDDLYFVADGTGGHVFARTLDEHNRNVAKWRQIRSKAEEGASNGARVSPGGGDAPSR